MSTVLHEYVPVKQQVQNSSHDVWIEDVRATRVTRLVALACDAKQSPFDRLSVVEEADAYAVSRPVAAGAADATSRLVQPRHVLKVHLSHVVSPRAELQRT